MLLTLKNVGLIGNVNACQVVDKPEALVKLGKGKG